MSAQPDAQPGGPKGPGLAREIRGPSAFGGSLSRFFNLTWMIAWTEFRLTYFGSVLGYLWSLMRPLMLFGTLYVVFTQIVKLGEGIPFYGVVLLMNIVCFTFFSEATSGSVPAVVQRENLVRKMQFPRMVIPLSVVLTAGLNLAVNMVAVFAFVFGSGITPRLSWLALPLVLLPLILLTSGLAMLLSSLYVRYRDVNPIWTVVSQVLFYGTPVIYVIDVVPKAYQSAMLCNPIAAILELLRKTMVDPNAAGPVEIMGALVIVPISLTILICVAGFVVFDREAPRIAEKL